MNFFNEILPFKSSLGQRFEQFRSLTKLFDIRKFIMDFLKSEAPFWKKETTSTGAIWIKENQVDKQKRLRW